jgi:hypothetical protein
MSEEPRLTEGRYYIIGDAGSFYGDYKGEPTDGFESPESALEWAKGRGSEGDLYPDILDDLADGVSAQIVEGGQYNKAMDLWDEWDDAGGDMDDWPEVEVHNYAEDLGLVKE